MTDISSGQQLLHQLETSGWTIIPNVVAAELSDALSFELERALTLRQNIRCRNKVDGSNDGTLHHLLADHPCFMVALAQLEHFDSLLKAYFSGNYILNSYGGVINRRDTVAYVHAIHRDIRFASDAKRFMLNILIMLDAFTLENGATHLLSGSQVRQEKPDRETFLKLSDRAIGGRGSALLFDSRLWHATGECHAETPRRALTLTFTSPFFKQQLDYPRLVGYDKAKAFKPWLRQVIGFNARVPASLDEYYVPVPERFYQRGQDD